MAGLRALIVGGALSLTLTNSAEAEELEPQKPPVIQLCLDSNLRDIAPADVVTSIMLSPSANSIEIRTASGTQTYQMDPESEPDSKGHHISESQCTQLCRELIDRKDSSELIGQILRGLGSAVGSQASSMKEESLLIAVLPEAAKSYLRRHCSLLGAGSKYIRGPGLSQRSAHGNHENLSDLSPVVLLSQQIREGQKTTISVLDTRRGLVYSTALCSARDARRGLN